MTAVRERAFAYHRAHSSTYSAPPEADGKTRLETANVVPPLGRDVKHLAPWRLFWGWSISKESARQNTKFPYYAHHPHHTHTAAYSIENEQTKLACGAVWPPKRARPPASVRAEFCFRTVRFACTADSGTRRQRNTARQSKRKKCKLPELLA